MALLDSRSMIQPTQSESPAEPDPKNHYIQLDGIRAFAALSVIVQHFTKAEGYTKFPAGLAGVWVFFVLSGYLITGILLKAKADSGGQWSGLTYAWRAFYARRIIRIFPLYYGVLFLVAAVGLPGVREGFGWYAGHLANFHVALGKDPAPSLPHFWSLAVEEQFYLVWPTLILLAPRRFALRIALAMIVVAPIARYLMISRSGDWGVGQSLPPGCLDGLGMGALLAFLREPGRVSAEVRDRFGRLALVVGLGIIAAVMAGRVIHLGYRLPFAIRYSGYSLVSFWLVNRAIDGFRGPAKWVLEAPPLVYVGKISYGIYVFHLVIPSLIEWVHVRTGYGLGMPEENGLGQFLYMTAASVGIASISWYFFEKPINDLKRFFPYKRPRSSSPGLTDSYARPLDRADPLPRPE